MELGTILLILSTHFVGDFIFQTDKQAKNKSSSNYWLTVHVATYGICLSFARLIMGNTLPSFYWVLINIVLHWYTDFVTSRINAYLWRKEMRHWFFVGIGLDQLIHYTCLFATYKALLN